MHIHTKGKLAERLARLYLLAKGYTAVPHHSPEIAQTDLLLRRGDTLVLVEVKYRSAEITAHHALSPAQLQRLARQARLLSRRFPGFSVRLDAVAVFPSWPFIRHLPNITPLA